ncbi:MAG: PorV/PorQ family protein [Candidatus Helarchaeota archaeon]|nr:PorV/PorQ family protein [Candidatus Helarchaeota archaeon]
MPIRNRTFRYKMVRFFVGLSYYFYTLLRSLSQIMKVYLNFIFFIFFVYSDIFGGGFEFAKFAGEFLSTGVGARPLGMGGAFVALANDGTAGYWNPSGLAFLNYPQIVLMHSERFKGAGKYDYVSLSFPYHTGRSIGFSLIRLGIDDIADTRNALEDYGLDGIPNTGDFGENNGEMDPGERLNEDKIIFFSNTDYAFFISYSKRQREGFTYGGNIKLIKRGIGEDSAFGVGFDIAVLLKKWQRLSLGANLMDATSTAIIWNTGRKELISPTLKLGMAYKIETKFFNGFVTPLIDWDVRFENRKFSSQYNVGPISLDPHYGIEINIIDRVFLRSGYDDIKRVAFGAGVKLPKLNIDYSFNSFDNIDQLGNTHRISITLTIEEEKFRRK